MQDVLLVAVVAAFFALCVAFVRACEAIIGRDELLDETTVDAATAAQSQRAA